MSFSNLQTLCSDSKELQLLTNVNTSDDLKNALLSKVDGKRLIDILISGGINNNEVLAQIIKCLSPQDWYEVLNIPGEDGFNAMRALVCSENIDSMISTVLTHLPSKKEMIDLITQRIPTGMYRMNRSVITRCNNENVILLLSNLDDNEKKQVLLSFTGGKAESNRLLECHDTTFLQKVLNLFQDDKIKEELKDYPNKYQLRKKATHFLGISDKKRFSNFKLNELTSMEIRSIPALEGWRNEYSLKSFNKMLNSYTPSDGYKEEFDEIKNAFNRTDDNAKNFDAYQEGELIVIPTGWISPTSAHSMTIAVKGEYLLISNRGAGYQGGCEIYLLKGIINRNDFLKLTIQSDSKEDMQKLTTSLTKENSRVIIPLSLQKYGTCVTSNKKGIVAGLLPFLKAYKTGQLESLTVQASSKEEYKKFSNYTRTSIVDEMLGELQSNKVNSNEIIDALSSFLNQHLDITKKNELELLYKIVKQIPDDHVKATKDRLSPFANFIFDKILEKGMSLSDLNILNDATKYFELLDDQMKIEFLNLVKKLISNSNIASNQDAYQWFENHFKFTLDSMLLNGFEENLKALTSEQLCAIFSKNNSENIVTMLKKIQQNEAKGNYNDSEVSKITLCLEYIFQSLSAQKITLLTPDVLKWIKSGSLLKIALEGLDKNTILEIFTKRSVNKEYAIIQANHDISYVQELETCLGKDFSQLFWTMRDNAEKRTLIANYISAPNLLSFILEKISDDEFWAHLANYRDTYCEHLLLYVAGAMQNYPNIFETYKMLLKKLGPKAFTELNEKNRDRLTTLETLSSFNKTAFLYTIDFLNQNEIICLLSKEMFLRCDTDSLEKILNKLTTDKAKEVLNQNMELLLNISFINCPEIKIYDYEAMFNSLINRLKLFSKYDKDSLDKWFASNLNDLIKLLTSTNQIDKWNELQLGFVKFEKDNFLLNDQINKQDTKDILNADHKLQQGPGRLRRGPGNCSIS